MIRDGNTVLNLGNSASLASSAGTVPPLTYTTGPSHNEGSSIRSSTGGNYASQATADIVFTGSAGGSFYRSYNPAVLDFNGKVAFNAVTSGNRDADNNRYVYTADVNADGYDDVVALSDNLSGNNAQINVYLGSKASSTVDANGNSISPFEAAIRVNIPTGRNLSSFDYPSLQDMTIADMNGDGIPDIVVGALLSQTSSTGGNPDTGGGSSSTFAQAVYSIGIGTGTGQFNFSTMAGTGPSFTGIIPLSRVTAGDFNGDGFADLAFGYKPGDVDGGNITDFIWFGTSKNPATSFNPSNKYSHNWQNAQDLQAVRANATDAADQLVLAFNKSTHIASFNADKSLFHDVKIDGTPQGPLGTEADYNGDGLPDIMYANGGSSTIGIGYDWTGLSSALTQVKIPTIGDDIQNATGIDFDGDGRLDFFGTKDSSFYSYFNTSGIASQTAAIKLAEGQPVAAAAINGVPQSLLTGDDNIAFSVTLLASVTPHRNAIGTYEIAQDGTIGAARFLNTGLSEGVPQLIGMPGAGVRLGFFVMTDGERLNGDLSGSFHFARSGGGAAHISDAATLLLRDGSNAILNGTIFHSADADPFDYSNPLNPGGRMQALSRGSYDGLTIAFEDTFLTLGDMDFNDMVLLVTRTDTGEVFGA